MTDILTSDPPLTSVQTTAGLISLTREGDPANPAIICIHGIPGSHRDFRYLAPGLRQQFGVIRVDFPGFGESPLGHVQTVNDWADTVLAIAAALSLERFYVLGHSFGGGAALQAASNWPDRVEGLILMASIGHRRHRGYGGIDPLFYRLMAASLHLPLIKSFIAGYARKAYETRGLRPPDDGDTAVLQRHLRLIGSVNFSHIGRLATTLKQQTLLIHCDDDHLVQISIPLEMATRIPRARLVRFPDGGHHLQKTRAVESAQAICETFSLAPTGTTFSKNEVLLK